MEHEALNVISFFYLYITAGMSCVRLDVVYHCKNIQVTF